MKLRSGAKLSLKKKTNSDFFVYHLVKVHQCHINEHGISFDDIHKKAYAKISSDFGPSV